MPFLICLSRRFPVYGSVTYQCGNFEGHNTVWNVSLMGRRKGVGALLSKITFRQFDLGQHLIGSPGSIGIAGGPKRLWKP